MVFLRYSMYETVQLKLGKLCTYNFAWVKSGRIFSPSDVLLHFWFTSFPLKHVGNLDGGNFHFLKQGGWWETVTEFRHKLDATQRGRTWRRKIDCWPNSFRSDVDEFWIRQPTVWRFLRYNYKNVLECGASHPVNGNRRSTDAKYTGICKRDLTSANANQRGITIGRIRAWRCFIEKTVYCIHPAGGNCHEYAAGRSWKMWILMCVCVCVLYVHLWLANNLQGRL